MAGFTLLFNPLLFSQIQMLPRHKVDSLVAANSAPKEWVAAFLSCPSVVYDAGDVAQDAPDIVAEFRFVNKGSDAVMLGRLESSCSCVRASVSPSFVLPDSTATVRAVYRQKGHVGRHPRYVRLYLAPPVDTLVATVRIDACVY